MTKNASEMDILVMARDHAGADMRGLNSKEEWRGIEVMLEYLESEGYIYIYRLPSGVVLPGDAIRGITPRGLRRLEELQHPVRAWMEANWFPLTVAVITSVIGIAGICLKVIESMG